MPSIAVAYNTETHRPETRKAALDQGLRGLDRNSRRMGTSDFDRKDLRLPVATPYSARIRASRPKSLSSLAEVVKP